MQVKPFIRAGFFFVLAVLLFSCGDDEEDTSTMSDSDEAGYKKPAIASQPISTEPPPTPDIPDVIPSTTAADMEAAFNENMVDEKTGLTAKEINQLIREEGGKVTSNRKARRWLRLDNLSSKLITLVENVSRGEVPYSELTILAPDKKFESSLKRGEALRINAQTHRRYKSVVDLVDAIDARAAIAFLKVAEPILESEYEQLGLSTRGGFRGQLRKAIDQVLAIKVQQSEVPLVRDAVVLKFADESMEKSNELTKLFYRIGPENSAVIQKKLREIKRLL